MSTSAARRFWLAELGLAAASAVVAIAIAIWQFRFWDASYRVPLNPSGDSLLGFSAIKGMIENGWYLHNPDLGAPFGQDAHDFYGFGGDTVQWLILRVLAFGTSDAGLLMNGYFFLGFGLIAGATYAALRGLTVSRGIAFAGGVLLSLIPYHFARGEGHLFLSVYIGVPAGGWLVMRTLAGLPVFARREGADGVRAWLTPLTAGSALAILVAGGSGLYYAVFTILLVGAAALVRGLADRSWRSLLHVLGVAATVGVTLAVSLLPGVVYQQQNGPNDSAAKRLVVESDIYSSNVTSLLLPSPNHRIGALGELGSRGLGDNSLIPGEGPVQLGLLLSLSAIALLIYLLAAAVRSGTRERSPTERLIAAAAAGVLVSTLLMTTGGLGKLIAILVSPQIRGWARIGPFVAFFALAGLAVAATSWRARMGERGVRRARLSAAVVPVVAVIALLDITAVSNTANYPLVADGWRSDARFVAEIERRLPEGAMVLQLPFHPFPEVAGDFRMADYDLLRGYIHSNDLRWSYGSMKGRPEDWTDEAAEFPTARMLDGAVAAGFAGIYVDRWGYPDYGAKLERTLTRRLGGGPQVVSADGRLSFFETAPLRERLERELSPGEVSALGESFTEPLDTSPAGGLQPAEGRGRVRWNWLGRTGELEIENPTSGPVPAVLTARAGGSPGARLKIAAPGRSVRTWRIRRGTEPIELRFTAPAGQSTIRFATRARRVVGDPRDLRVQLFSLRVTRSDVPAAFLAR